MAEKAKTAEEIVNNVFPGTVDPTDFAPQIKTTFKDAQGAELKGSDWVARVSSMSLSLKVTPKIGDTYVSVERALTVELNTLDKEIVQEIWKDLQKQVVGGVFSSLSLAVKQLSEAKK